MTMILEKNAYLISDSYQFVFCRSMFIILNNKL